MRDEHNPDSYPDKLHIQNIGDLPAFMRDPILSDAGSIKTSLSSADGKQWLCENLALLKYQVEGAHERLDEMKDAIGQLVLASNRLHDAIAGAQEEDTSDDWWKEGRR